MFLYDGFNKKSPLFSSNGDRFVVSNISRKPEGKVLVNFRECSDRTAAEKLKGIVLYQDMKLGSSEFWIDELVGKFVKVGEAQFGISAIRNYGAGDLIELDYNGRSVLIPFRKEFVKNVDSGEVAFQIDEAIFSAFLGCC